MAFPMSYYFKGGPKRLWRVSFETDTLLQVSPKHWNRRISSWCWSVGKSSTEKKYLGRGCDDSSTPRGPLIPVWVSRWCVVKKGRHGWDFTISRFQRNSRSHFSIPLSYWRRGLNPPKNREPRTFQGEQRQSVRKYYFSRKRYNWKWVYQID